MGVGERELCLGGPAHPRRISDVTVTRIDCLHRAGYMEGWTGKTPSLFAPPVQVAMRAFYPLNYFVVSNEQGMINRPLPLRKIKIAISICTIVLIYVTIPLQLY